MTECINNIEKIVFWHDNADITDWTLTASTEAANHPVKEIQNESVGLTWRSTTNASSWVEGNSGTALPFYGETRRAGFVFVNNNFDQNTNIQIQLWNGATPLYNNFFDGRIYPTGSIGGIPPYQNRVIYIPEDFFAVTRWRVTFSSSALPYYEVGVMFAGTAFRPTNGAREGDLEIIPVDNSKVQYSKGKNAFTDLDPKSRALSFSMNQIEDLQINVANPNNNLLDWCELIFNTGTRNAVFVDPYPVVTPAISPYQNYGLLNAISQMYGNLFANGGIRPTSLNTAIVPSFKFVESL